MKTNVKLIAGGVAAMLLPVAAGVAFFVWAEGAAAPSATAAEAEAETPAVDPVPSPNLEPSLAATHRPSVAPAPTPREDEPEEPAVDPFEPILTTSGPIRVRRLVVSTGVRGHEPTGADDVFELGGQRRLYAFVDAANATGEDVALRVTFEPEEGESAGHVALDVPAGAPRWRTWAWTRHVYTPGRWHAVVRGPDGRELARRAFDVVD